MKIIIKLFLLIISLPVLAQDDLGMRYGVNDLYSKIVDNRGNGEERLYGLRNARLLFKNILRGGANNAYHRTAPRSNTNPLPEDGLTSLCREGFSTAIYLYETNYETASQDITCVNDKGLPQRLVYLNHPYSKTESAEKILRQIYAHITEDKGSLYLHCWNGWHASGFFSAIALRQFCDFSAEEAVTYWDKNTDGVNTEPGYETIRKKIRAFIPYPDLKLNSAQKSDLCSYAN